MSGEVWDKRPLKARGRRSAPTNRQTAEQLAKLREDAREFAERDRVEEQARQDAAAVFLRKAREDAQR